MEMWKTAPAGDMEKCSCGNRNAGFCPPGFVLTVATQAGLSDAFVSVPPQPRARAGISRSGLLSLHQRSGCDFLYFRAYQRYRILRIGSVASSDVGELICLRLGVGAGAAPGASAAPCGDSCVWSGRTRTCPPQSRSERLLPFQPCRAVLEQEA